MDYLSERLEEALNLCQQVYLVLIVFFAVRLNSDEILALQVVTLAEQPQELHMNREPSYRLHYRCLDVELSALV